MRNVLRPGSREESAEEKRIRAARVVDGLARLYPDAECALRHRSALELLVATILSAQCTDERVNLVTPALFRAFPTAAAYASAEPGVLEEMIRTTGFFRSKTRSLIAMGRDLLARHGGEVPDSMDELVKIRGVGRKTAHVVLGTWFGKPALFVDTHVSRLAGRLALSSETDPVKIERDLGLLLPEERWTFACHALIWHGRRVCKARKPACESCGVRPDCPFPLPSAAAR